MMNIKEDRTINKNNICNKFIGGAYRKPDYSIILSSNAISQLDSKKESLGLNLALWQRYFDAYFTYMAFDAIVQRYDQKNGDNYKKTFYFGDMKKDINTVIKETIDEYIENNAIVLLEFGNDDYLDAMKSLLHPIFDNLACIAIFHDLDNIDIIGHWANRAKTLPSKLMVEKIRSGKRENIIPIAFSIIFGDNYEDIDDNWYAMLIKYYKDDNRDFKLIANDIPNNYHIHYTPIIATTMEELKNAFIEMNYERWSIAVNDYVSKVTNK